MMGAVWFRFRAELRQRWRAWLGLAVLAGLATGGVIALAAGARRTDSAYPRYLEAQNAADLLFPFTSGTKEEADAYFDEIAALPQVAESARAGFGQTLPIGVLSLAPLDQSFGRDLNRPDLVEGRLPDSDRPEQVALSVTAAGAADLHVGDTINAVPPAVLADLSAQGSNEPLFRQVFALEPVNTLQVVGIVTAPGTFPPQASISCCAFHSEAFAAAAGASQALAVRLEDGASSEEFVDEVERRTGMENVLPLDAQAVEVERTIHVQAMGLWLLAGLGAVVAVLVIGQLLSRLTFIEAVDNDALSALGMSRRQRIALAVVRAAAVGGVGAVVGVTVAVCLSPFFPTGLAGTAEPDPGLSVDVTALALGALATVVVVVVLCAVPAWLASKAGPRMETGAPRRQPRLLALLSRSGAPLPAVAGTRMAITRGRGRAAVPVGSSLGAIGLGIAVLVAALTFAASLQHLLDTPRLYGVGWDVQLYGPELAELLTPVAERRSEVLGLAVGATNLFADVQDQHVGLVGLDPVRGDIRPPALEGRRPTASDEVALGTETMEALDAAIGDTIEVQASRTERFTIVGRTVLPSTTDGASLGRGGLLSVSGFASLASENAATDLFVDLAPGTDVDDFVAELDEEVSEACRASGGEACEVSTFDYPPPADIANFGRVVNVPVAMGAVFGALAAGTLVHVVVTSVRRRRRDLALLKTLGFTPRQLVLTVTCSATATVLIGLLVGIPVGLAAGRWLWTVRAEELGVVVDPRLPYVVVALVGVVAVVLAAVIGLLLGRTAARTGTADVLRAE